MLNHKNISILFGSLILILFTLNFFVELKVFYFLFISFCWLVITVFGSFDIRLDYFTSAYCSGNKINKNIAITFDDGPSQETITVLDILKKHNVKATFFCVGLQIEKHPDIFKRILDEGHLIGNHTYSHPKSMGFISTKRVKEEITKTDEIINLHSGKKPLFYRPPFGVTNPRIANAIAVLGHKVIGWNIRSLDTLINDQNKILNRIKSKVKPGGIILLHDTSYKTTQVLEQLLLFLQSENYLVTPLDEMLKLKAYED